MPKNAGSHAARLSSRGAAVAIGAITSVLTVAIGCGKTNGYAGAKLLHDTLVYVATSASTIEWNRFDVELETFTAGDSAAAASTVRAIAVSPDSSLLVSADGTASQLTSYRIDPVTGALNRVGSYGMGAGATDARGLAFAPSGKFVYAAAYGTSKVSAFGVSADGSLSLIGNYAAQSGTFAIAISPDGAHLYAAGASAGIVHGYSISADGSLQAFASGTDVSLGVGSSPNSLAVTADSRFLLVTYYSGTDPKVSTFALGASTGFPESSAAGTAATGDTPVSVIPLTATGEVLLGASGSNEVSTYSLDSSSGALAQTRTTMLAAGPVGLALSPDGTRAFAALATANSLIALDPSGLVELDLTGTSPPRAIAATQLPSHR